MKYQIGDEVIVINIEGKHIKAIIKGYMMIQRGSNLEFKPELVYIIKEVSADTDQLYVDVSLKLYHVDCIYQDEKELSSRGLPVKPSQKPDLEKPIPESDNLKP